MGVQVRPPAFLESISQALSGVDDKRTVSFLKRRLRDKDEQIRAPAVDALVGSVGVRSQPVLQSQLTKEKSPSERRVIRDALSFAACWSRSIGKLS